MTLTLSVEVREVMEARRPRHDETAIRLGRVAQSLAASGAVDPELALSFVAWPTPELLEAVAKAD